MQTKNSNLVVGWCGTSSNAGMKIPVWRPSKGLTGVKRAVLLKRNGAIPVFKSAKTVSKNHLAGPKPRKG